VRDAGLGFPVTTAIRMASTSVRGWLMRGTQYGPFGP
jgi:hypothetical protein